ncbi:MAG: B12-binding domain-containing radical SAM protein, partial [Candidatus Omnitrophica bacterium]|nr:B12-binding domain-containing radical SAM protein [Candidatus Omnitrophota bacterium]
AEYRRRGVPVVMGGMHATLIPDEVKQHCDAVFIGDAEFLWREVVDDAAAGKLKPVYRAQVGRPQPGVLTRRDIFKGKGYLPVSLMQFSRGCRFACNFCAISVFFNKTHFVRDVKEVAREIESQERKLVFFVDDNILSNHEAAKILCRELIPLKIRWISQASIDMTQDRELMRLLVKSGCLGNVIGFESIDRQNLRSMRKSSNFIGGFDDYSTPLKIIREYGLQTWAAFTLGHDHDTVESVRATARFAIENKFCFGAFNILMPYPNTPLYAKLEKEGRLLYDGKWWLHPRYRFNYASFVPRCMTPEELTSACFQARRSFNSIGSILSRACDPATNMRSLYRFLFYMTYNPLYRKETFKKQGMKFGLTNHRAAERIDLLRV